ALDPVTGDRRRRARRGGNRYEHRTPGAMIHVDVKKLGRIPTGGGWRLHGRTAAVSVANRHKKTKIGYDYIHTAIDDHTRLAYSEALDDEKDTTSAAFLHRALTWFADHGIPVHRVLTDNALVEVLLIFRTANPLGFSSGREGACVEESSIVYS